jgi:hypothetical protein
MEYAQTNDNRNFGTTSIQMIKKLKYKGKSASDLNTKYNELSFDLAPGDDFNDYKDFILEHISFIKILRSFKLHPDECFNGRYTHRMICPFRFHKNGRERTGSFRLNADKKTFNCFGCNVGGDILKFLQLFIGGSEQYHLEKLATLAGLIKDGEIQLPKNYIIPEEAPPKETNHKILFDAGLMLRNYLLELINTRQFIQECEWADQMLEKLDKQFSIIEEDNLHDAQKIYDKLQNVVNKRKINVII